MMNEEEEALARDFYDALMAASRGTERSKQAGRYQVGVSDIGFCPERTRRMLDGQDPEDTDVMLAWIGTALGDHAEKAWAAKHSESIIQSSVTLALTIDIDGKPVRINIPGHPDIIDPAGRLLDVKTDYGLADAERIGPSFQQQVQRHGYAKAAHEAGLFNPGVQLADVKVGNVWIDRSGQDKRVHVDLEPFDEGWIEKAAAWLEDVVYHQVRGSEAHKAPPRDMCAVVCGFYDTCRVLDTDVEGLIEDPVTIARVKMYREGLDLEKEGRRLKDQAKDHLQGVSGMTSEWMVRQVFVGDSVVPEHVRKGYTKIDIRPIPKARRR